MYSLSRPKKFTPFTGMDIEGVKGGMEQKKWDGNGNIGQYHYMEIAHWNGNRKEGISDYMSH